MTNPATPKTVLSQAMLGVVLRTGMGTLKALKRRPNNKHHNPCWSQPRKVEPTNISLRETFDTHEPPRKQLASRRNSESTSRYLRSLLTLGNEGARRYTIAAGKTRPVAPVASGTPWSRVPWRPCENLQPSPGNTSEPPIRGRQRRREQQKRGRARPHKQYNTTTK